MSRSRAPTAIPVNGAAMLVRDPNSGTGDADIFRHYQRVPGLASFTLPDEVGTTNEVNLMDGNVATAQTAGVGTITGTLGSMVGHVTHRFLADRKKDGKEIDVSIIRPGVKLSSGTIGVSHPANGLLLTFPAAFGSTTVKQQVKEGTLVAVGATGDTLGGGVVIFGDTVAAADDHKFRPVLAVSENGQLVKVEAAISTALNGGNSNKYEFRTPGVLYENIRCTVNGFGDGDYQSGGVVSGTISLQPILALPTQRPEYRTLAELRSDTSWRNTFGTVS